MVAAAVANAQKESEESLNRSTRALLATGKQDDIESPAAVEKPESPKKDEAEEKGDVSVEPEDGTSAKQEDGEESETLQVA